MKKLQPITLTLDGDNKYLVRFQTEAGETVDYVFTIDDSEGFDLLVSDIEFLELTEGDPAADRLRRAIGSFHTARNFEYEKESAKTAELKVTRTDEPRKASA